MQRVKPGDGRPLKPYRWWQWLSRGLFYVSIPAADGAERTYAVNVNYWDYLLNEAAADLYVQGAHHARSKLPAAFPVPGGHIEVAMGAMGLKRCHYVSEDGTTSQLTPDPDSAEGHRAALDRRRPVLSRWIGIGSLAILVIALLLGVPQLIELVTRWDLIAEYTGTWTSPVQLPDGANGALTAAAVLASVERALRLRYNWLLDGGDFDSSL